MPSRLLLYLLIGTDIGKIPIRRLGPTLTRRNLAEVKYPTDFARLGPKAPVRSLRDIIDFNVRNKKTEMPFFGQDRLLKAEAKGPLTSYEYLEALAKCRRLRLDPCAMVGTMAAWQPRRA
jgi:hypothetical protein